MGQKDDCKLVYGAGNPLDTNVVLLHHATQGEVKKRNEPEGLHVGLLGNFCLVMIFSYWEQRYREKISKDMGLNNKNDLTCDVIGDIRHYRNDILKSNGIVTKGEGAKNVILKFFKEGEIILINRKKMGKVMEAMMNDLRKLADKSGQKLLTRNPITYTYKKSSIFDP